MNADEIAETKEFLKNAEAYLSRLLLSRAELAESVKDFKAAPHSGGIAAIIAGVEKLIASYSPLIAHSEQYIADLRGDLEELGAAK